MPRQWIVSQIGAREHYAVPRALHARGLLRVMLTEAWCRRGGRLLRRGPHALRALAARRHDAIPDDRVVSFTLAALGGETARRLARLVRPGPSWHADAIAIGEAFCRRVNTHLQRAPLDPEADAFFGYDTGCLETLRFLAERGVPTVVDQIDPGRVEVDLVAEEAARWPGWQSVPEVPVAYWDRLAAEWDAATVVVVNSPWSRDALVQQGVCASKIRVVPLAYEGPATAPVRDADPGRPLSVLWLGSVILRKGIQYLLEAARQLAGTPVRFVVAGSVLIDPRFVARAPDSVTFVGEVTRDRASALYASADVFILPTLSDGFGLTQLEAMAHGLPVIATPNCGDVVTDGEDGLVVPIRDPEAIATAIRRLDADRGLLAEMSERARERASAFTLGAVADQLGALFESPVK